MKSLENGESYTETLSRGGFRFTRQRRQVYDALMEQRDHPTALDVFMRVKDRMPTISLATVYNCLETLTHVGLVKQVNLERAPSRYCPNLQEHAHFFCDTCGEVLDVPVRKDRAIGDVYSIPKGCVVTSQEFSLRGLCPGCTKKQPKRNTHTNS